MELGNKYFGTTLKTWLLIGLLLFAVIATTYFVVKSQANTYYQQQYEQEAKRYKWAALKIDSLEKEKRATQIMISRLAKREDSILQEIKKTYNHLKNTNENANATYRNIDRWDISNLDSFFAKHSAGQKGR